jgi:hypothetical protein
MPAEGTDEERLATQRRPLERGHETALHLRGHGHPERLHDHHPGLAEELLARGQMQPDDSERRAVTQFDLHGHLREKT